MFSQVCVKNSVQIGGGHIQLPWQTSPGQTPRWGDVPEQTPPEQTPRPEMATAANSTHPTGMHSCFIFVSTPLNNVSYLLHTCIQSDSAFCAKYSFLPRNLILNSKKSSYYN